MVTAWATSPAGAAQQYENLLTTSSELRPLQGDQIVAPATPGALTLYRLSRNADGTLRTSDSAGWITDVADKSHVKGQLNDDATERTVVTHNDGTQPPRIIDATGADRLLGVPAPPKLTLAANITDEFTIDDALTWVDEAGASVTESQYAILRAAECGPETPALERQANHHELVALGTAAIAAEERSVGGQLGRPSGARFRTYERLKRYADEVKGTLWDAKALGLAIEEIYRFPLRPAATDTLNRMLRSGVSDEDLARRVIELRDEDRLCVVHEEEAAGEPRIICSLGLASGGRAGQP